MEYRVLEFKYLRKLFVSCNRGADIRALMCFMLYMEVIRVVKTSLQDDCSGAGSRCNSIRAVMSVMGIHIDCSDCTHEFTTVNMTYGWCIRCPPVWSDEQIRCKELNVHLNVDDESDRWCNSEMEMLGKVTVGTISLPDTLEVCTAHVNIPCHLNSVTWLSIALLLKT